MFVDAFYLCTLFLKESGFRVRGNLGSGFGFGDSLCLFWAGVFWGLLLALGFLFTGSAGHSCSGGRARGLS